MSATNQKFEDFYKSFDRSKIAGDVLDAEQARIDFIKKFPLSEWSTLPLERYAYGLKDSKSSYCWALERGTKKIALLATNNSRWFKIYFSKKNNRWWFDGDYEDEKEAWTAIRGIYTAAFAKAERNEWGEIDSLHTSHLGTNALLKSLYCYFPDHILPVTSTSHLAHFLSSVGVRDYKQNSKNIVTLNRLLLTKLRERADFQGWTTKELERFLYKWAPVEEDKASTDDEFAVSGGEPIDDTMFKEIADALHHKKQVILFGPPGTGKTYTAERFADQWLRLPKSSSTADDVLSGPRQTWLLVTNPKHWSWDTMFEQGSEVFHGGKIKANFEAAQKGDIVFGYTGTPQRKLEAMARVKRPMFINDEDVHCIEFESLAQIENGLTFDDLQNHKVLSQSEPVIQNMRGTLFKLSAREAQIVANLTIKRDSKLSEHLAPITETTSEIAAPHVDHLINLTFHPSYSYEDFIEGYRPVASTDNLTLKLKEGIFKRICREAVNDPNGKFLIIIDEINRANVAKVFGEVMTILEKDKRGKCVELPQSNEQFLVPPNVYIIGTMNTADRSIKLFDIALRRRFAFIEMQPNSDLLTDSTIDAIDLKLLLEYLNAKLAAAGYRDKQIGHSFFMIDGQPVNDLDEFARQFRQDVLPLLQEYCYEDFTELANYIGTDLINLEEERLVIERLNNSDMLVSSLAKLITKGSA